MTKLSQSEKNIFSRVMNPETAVKDNLLHGNATRMPEQDISEIEAQALDGWTLKVMPAAFYAQFSRLQLAHFANKHAFYGLPTNELVEWLIVMIDNRSAIEIGSGNGALGRALKIHRTDNWLQSTPEVREWYRQGGIKTINYPNDVKKLDYQKAILKYRPQVVIGQWVTNIELNNLGLDERWILDNCDTYIHVGHSQVHKGKTIRDQPYKEYYPEGLYSRSHREGEVVWVW